MVCLGDRKTSVIASPMLESTFAKNKESYCVCQSSLW